MSAQPQSLAHKKLDEIMALGWDTYTTNLAETLRTAFTLMPMSMVLAEVEGDSVGDRIKRAGVSRNTWYLWQRGQMRPTKKQALRLQRITGIKAEKFQGRR